jgi:hypothetical protein
LAELPGELVWPVALPSGELLLLPLFWAFAAVVTGGAGSGVGATGGATALAFPFPFPFPLLCVPAVSAALVLVGAAASGVTGTVAGEVLCALVVVVGSPLLLVVVVAAGWLVVLVVAAFAFPLPFPLPLSARASAGDTRKAAKARIQTESARNALWMRPERVDVSHVRVLTAPDRSPFKRNRKTRLQKLPICLSPPRRRVLIRCTIVLLDHGAFNRSEVRSPNETLRCRPFPKTRSLRFGNAADTCKKTQLRAVFSRACNGVQRQATPVAETRKAAIHQEVTLVARRFGAI